MSWAECCSIQVFRIVGFFEDVLSSKGRGVLSLLKRNEDIRTHDAWCPLARHNPNSFSAEQISFVIFFVIFASSRNLATLFDVYSIAHRPSDLVGNLHTPASNAEVVSSILTKVKVGFVFFLS